MVFGLAKIAKAAGRAAGCLNTLGESVVRLRVALDPLKKLRG